MARKQINGSRASVREKDGVWCVRIITRYGERGNRKRKEKLITCGTTEADRLTAEEYAQEFNEQELRSEEKRDGRTFLGWHTPGVPYEFLCVAEDWVLFYGPTIKELSRRKFEVDIRTHLKYFHGLDLARLTETRIVEWASQGFDAGRGYWTIVNACTVLIRLIQLGCTTNCPTTGTPHLDANPVPGLTNIVKRVAKSKGVAPKTAQPFTKEELRVIFRELRSVLATPPRAREPREEREAYWRSKALYPVLLTLVTTGIRISEVKGMRRQDVFLDDSKIHICNAISADLEGLPKTGKTRWIGIPPQLKPVLEELVRSPRPANQNQQYVFLAPKGQPWKTAPLESLWRKVRKDLNEKHGVRELGFHAFRHTFASLAIDSGQPFKRVANYLGHSVTVLEKTYAHLISDSLEDFSFQEHIGLASEPLPSGVTPLSKLAAGQ